MRKALLAGTVIIGGLITFVAVEAQTTGGGGPGTSIVLALANAIVSIATTGPVCGSGTAGKVQACGATMTLPNGTTATTQATNSNDTKVATDALVLADIASALPSVATTTPLTGTGSAGGVQAATGSLVLPNGTTATTPSTNDNTTKVATTANVMADIASAIPNNGTTVTTCFSGSAGTVAACTDTTSVGATATNRSQKSLAFSGGKFSSNGDSQWRVCQMRGQSTGGSGVRLTTDGSGTAGSSNICNLPTNSAYSCNVLVVALDQTTKGSYHWAWSYWSIQRAGTASVNVTTSGPSFSNLGTQTGTPSSSSLGNGADSTYSGFSFTFTPVATNTNTWDVVANVTCSEVQ